MAERKEGRVELRVIPNPHKAYSGKPLGFVQCKWVDHRGVQSTGNPMLEHIISDAGLDKPEPGDTIIVTIEVIKGVHCGKEQKHQPVSS